MSTDVRKAAAPPPGGGVHAFHDSKPIRQDGGDDARPSTMTLKVGDRPVLTYQAAVAEPPAGVDPVFRRSGFIHPLQTPSGAVITDDFPPDHAHQHGVFFAWVNTTFETRHVDFWNQKLQTGRVSQDNSRDAYGNEVDDGPVFGELIASLFHEDLTAPPDVQVKVLGVPLVGNVAKRVLREVWQVAVYDIPGVFVVDFMSAQHIDHHPLTINEYHYGGFGLRGNRQWYDPAAEGKDPPDTPKRGRCEFLTSEGKHRADGNRTRTRWVDLSGEVDGKMCGVTVLDHPGNFRFPQPVRLHPTKPYFCFAPMVLGEFSIVVGKPYVSRYRLVVHDGPPDPALIERLWNDYAEPPRVRIVADDR